MANASAGKSGSGTKVLVAGSVLQLFLGIIYVWSKFVAPVSRFFAGDGANLAEVTKSVKLTSSFMLGFFVLGILVGGRLQGKLKADKIVLLGGLLMAAGMLAASFLPASAPVFLIYIFYGVVGGFGVGMAYNTIIS
ncbi:MAG: hypothetical protein LBB50_07065, partial [Oscillospiraceae bacterium]|nr:hypothetical protein [Oscillospiraceae bacterium]